MSNQMAYIKLTNNTPDRIIAQLYHQNSSDGAQAYGAVIEKGATASMLAVPFQTGLEWAGTEDYWFLVVHVVQGASSGTYVSGSSGSTINDPKWFECQLQKADAGKTCTFAVTTSAFSVNLPSNSSAVTVAMTRLRDYKRIQNVFVLMLENHSFDNMLAFSGIPDIQAATTSDSNSIGSTTYNVVKGAPYGMPTDPGHEFEDVLEQLCGAGTTYSGGAYPTVNLSGFAANYSTSTTEGPAPQSSDIGDIMACYDTPNALPVMRTLAQNFTVCNHWYSSMPGPTWPNRFFVHGATSGGMDDSPSTEWMAEWEYGDGYSLPNGTVFDLLKSHSWSFANGPSSDALGYRIYNDCAWSVEDISGAIAAAGVLGPAGIAIAIAEIPANSLYSDNPDFGGGVPGFGWMPQVASLENISALGIRSMSSFSDDLVSPYGPAYTFIEPHYGNGGNKTYMGGSSQHPSDDTYGGEALLRDVYQRLRISALWYTSMLVVLYDEHGGFYDSRVPPTATAPGDGGDAHNSHGFDFTRYGVRVPALIISPFASAGVANATFDHSSVPKALEQLFSLPNLTNRDKLAEDPSALCTLTFSGTNSYNARTNCPTTLPNPVKGTQPGPSTLVIRPDLSREPIPERGNYVGFLHILVKTEIELSDGSPEARAAIMERVRAIRTRGDAGEYAKRVSKLIAAARRERGMHLTRGPAGPLRRRADASADAPADGGSSAAE